MSDIKGIVNIFTIWFEKKGLMACYILLHLNAWSILSTFAQLFFDKFLLLFYESDFSNSFNRSRLESSCKTTCNHWCEKAFQLLNKMDKMATNQIE